MEPGTTEIARDIAGVEFSFYSFVSKKKSDVHIKSENFTEETGVALVKAHSRTISVHGVRDGDHAYDIYVGGLEEELKRRVLEALNAADFSAIEDRIARHSGRDPRNICNRGSSRQGVQLEITNRLRGQLFRDLNRKGRKETRPLFAHLIRTIRAVLLNYRGLRA
jgi:phage replication-related protein YjqB (UPF0714/DUF867 family)